MADIAKIGATFDTSDLQKGKAAIQALVPPAKAAETAVAGLETAMEGAGAAASTQAAPGAKKAASAFAEASGAATSAGSAFKSAAAGATAFNIASGAAVGRTKQFAANLGDFSSHMVPYRASLAGARKDLKLTTTESLNTRRQLADIGVTGLSGMSPLLIAIQQGPQLLDIFQQAAIRTGTTVGAVFRAAAASALAALLPLLPLILAVGAAVAVVAGGFALVTREFNKGNKDITAGMGLTEKQLERLKEKGVETGVTIGDTWNGFFMTVGDRFKKAFAGPLDWLAKAWKTTMDFLFKSVTVTVGATLGAFVGSFRAVVAVWKLLPAAFGDIAVSTANIFLKTIEAMINTAVQKINMLINFANAAAKAAGVDVSLGQVGSVSIDLISNPNEGAAMKAGKVTAEAFISGFKDVSKWQSEFFKDWEKNAEKAARKRIKPLAGAVGATPKDKNSGGFDSNFVPMKVDGEFENAFEKPNKEWAAAAKVRDDYFKDARARTASIKQEYSYIGMSADAVTRLRIENELFAQAKEKQIMLTPETVAGIKAEAAAQADFTIATQKAAEALDFAKSNTKSFVNDLRMGLQQGQSVWESFGNAVLNVLNRIIDKMLDAAIDNMFDKGSGGSGFFGSVFSGIGSLFGGGGSTPTFGGGSSGNSGGALSFAAKGEVLNGPTAFNTSKGVTIGGEAGDEALIPLARGSDGSLGVQMYGSQGGGQNINAPVSVSNTYVLSGAVSSADVIALNRAAAEQTKEEVKRSLISWLEQHQRDGTIV